MSAEEKPVNEEHDAGSCRRTVSLPVQKVPLFVIRFASSLASIWGIGSGFFQGLVTNLNTRICFFFSFSSLS